MKPDIMQFLARTNGGKQYKVPNEPGKKRISSGPNQTSALGGVKSIPTHHDGLLVLHPRRLLERCSSS